jgi:Ca2+-transporting ATPase
MSHAASPTVGFSVVHRHLRGRMRIAVTQTFRDAERAAALERTLRATGHFHSVAASSLTGRMLLTFDPQVTHAEIVERIAAALRPPSPPPEARGADDVPAMLNGALVTGQKGGNSAITIAPTAAGKACAESTSAPLRAWHAMKASEVLAALDADRSAGLSEEEARRRLRRHGFNKAPEPPAANDLAMLARQFSNLPTGLLLAASAVSVATGGVIDAVVTLAVVGINAAIGFGTESGSERIIRGMTRRQSVMVPVLRMGEERLVPRELIVPGDILVLKPSVLLAADARLIETSGLQTNEALLTGESEPVEKDAGAVCDAGEALSHRRNMAFQGAYVVNGTGRAVVVATGAGTETSRIETETREVATPKTPLERDLDNLGGQLALLSLGACGAFFLVGFLRGRTWFSMFNSALALAVAAVPEGLPATATTTLALGLRELRRKGVIVRRLEAVEGLGSLQVICFDKTGTLTENCMRLERLHIGDGNGGVGAAWPEARDTVCPASLRRLFEIGILCSEVGYGDGAGAPELSGSATERAIVEGGIAFGIAPASLNAAWPRRRLQYRSEEKRFMASFHAGRDGGGGLVAIKGDPHQVLERCSVVVMPDGTSARLDADLRRALTAHSNDLAGRGLRVLGFAYGEGALEKLSDENLAWVGAAGLKDPVVDGAKALIQRLHAAGVRPVMITGDQAATAEAIAREIELSGEEPLRVLDSTALDRLSPQLLAAVAQRTHVFARVPPTKKLHIVRALQRAGLTVGMIGDGFNDAPALKAADIAIAVGADSATAARDVADVIIAGDGLAVIGDGIEQGRTILSNIRKSVHYLLSTNFSEIIVLMVEALGKNDTLESPMELLWLNLVTDVMPSLGLALEPAERFVMAVPPRRADEPLLTTPDLQHSAVESAIIAAASLGAHAYGNLRYGPGPQTRTVTFLSLVATQLLHALACRHDRFEPLGGRSLFGNAPLNAAVLASAGLQALPFLVPPLRRFLGVAMPQPLDLAVVGLSGLAAFASTEAMLAYRSSAAGGVITTRKKRRRKRRIAASGIDGGNSPCATSF